MPLRDRDHVHTNGCDGHGDERGVGPLTAEEQAMIDSAWQTHRDALTTGPSRVIENVLNHKTLLDGFGEATDQVVALRAENEQLRNKLLIEHDMLIDTDHALHARDREVERLRSALQEIAGMGAWGVGAISIAQRALAS